MKKVKKILSVIMRGLIKSIHCLSHRAYMNVYVRYLKNLGFKINGKPGYIHPSVIFDGKAYSQTVIGDRCIISRDVLFLCHDYSLQTGFRSIGVDDQYPRAHWIKGISLGDNVFIGARCTLLPGTEIGENCIIGAGSVVKGRIPANMIVLGNPAKIVANIKEWAGIKLGDGDFLLG